ncbi:helix-turn-helix domain-containing protein [Desulfocicer niacini]
MDTKTIGMLVRKARKRQKFTQAEAAGYLNVGIRFLSDLENGKSTVQMEKALQVLEGVGYKIMIIPKSKYQLIRHIEENLDNE